MLRLSQALPAVGAVALATLAWHSNIALADDWSPSDTIDEQQSDTAFNQNDFVRAESISRAVLDRHPDSVSALLYHVKDLEALNQTAQALPEARHALDLSPTDATAAEWYGLALVRTGQGSDATIYLYLSHKLNPREESTSLWLAHAYELNKQPDEAKKVIDGLLATENDQQKGDTEHHFADTYYQIGDKADALLWWHRAAQLGNPYAAQWLVWAYSNNYGGAGDSGDAAYWQRRTASPTFPWFPRLPFADQVVAWAGGWGLVAIAMSAAVILPLFTMTLAAFCCSGGLTTDPYIHWTERARASYSFQVFLTGALIFLPLVHFAGAVSYPASLLPVPKNLLLLVIYVTTLLTSNAVFTHWARRYRSDVGSQLQNLKDLGVTIYIYLSTLVLMGLIASFLPAEWNLRAALILLAAILFYLWFNFGGWLRLGRLLGIFRPADAELRTLVVNLAQHIGQPAPTPWIVNWSKANAYAVVLSNAVCVTKKLREILSPAEMEAVVAHEMAHISENRTTRAIRLVLPLVMFMPLFTFGLWDPSSSPYGLLVAFGSPLLGLTVHQRLARRMEVRADALAQKAESAPAVYPTALSKIYEANLVPAVMPGKRQVHPHLYDRLLAAGVTPDFPRPQPPRRWGIWVALVITALNYACLSALWLALF